MKEEILSLAEELNADGVKQGKSWKGYEVFIPQYKKGSCVGFPYVILVKDGNARICTEKESTEYLHFEQNR